MTSPRSTTAGFPGYVHCYSEGHRLCAAFVGDDPERFKRLLVEQIVPSDLVS